MSTVSVYFSFAKFKTQFLRSVIIARFLFSLPELSESASDPLELDENYVIQKLTMDLPMQYDIVGK